MTSRARGRLSARVGYDLPAGEGQGAPKGDVYVLAGNDEDYDHDCVDNDGFVERSGLKVARG